MVGGKKLLSNWEKDKKWSDKFIPEIKQVLSDVFIDAAPEYEDQRHNTDLMVLMFNPVRIACRIRTYQYYINYPNDITIRKDRPSNADTEMVKLMSGYGDYMFYGFSNKSEDALCAWKLIDLKKFRLWVYTALLTNNGITPGTIKNNNDGSSSFYAFDTKLMGSDVILKKYPNDIITE